MNLFFIIRVHLLRRVVDNRDQDDEEQGAEDNEGGGKKNEQNVSLTEIHSCNISIHGRYGLDIFFGLCEGG
jgi:hypothetical protein